MSRHLSEEELIELLELGGEGPSGPGVHVGACAHCAARLEHAREGLALALTATEVPEPAPVFWEAFGRRVRQRVGAGDAVIRRWVLGPLLAAAAASVALVAVAPVTQGPEPLGAPIPAWSALPSEDEDLGLAVLAELAPSGDDVGPVGDCGLLSCLVDLSEEESLDLAAALRAELEGRAL